MLDAPADFQRKWSGCFVRLKDTEFVAFVGQVSRKTLPLYTKPLGQIDIPYTKAGLDKIEFLLPDPGYYQIGSNTYYLLRTGARQFRRGLGQKNYVLISPINTNFGTASRQRVSDFVWDIGTPVIDYTEADAILTQTLRGLPPASQSLGRLLNKNNKEFVSVALTRHFAASLSPYHKGLLLYLWNRYVANLDPDTKIVSVINPYFGQETQDFVRDHLQEYRCVV